MGLEKSDEGEVNQSIWVPGNAGVAACRENAILAATVRRKRSRDMGQFECFRSHKVMVVGVQEHWRRQNGMDTLNAGDH